MCRVQLFYDAYVRRKFRDIPPNFRDILCGIYETLPRISVTFRGKFEAFRENLWLFQLPPLLSPHDWSLTVITCSRPIYRFLFLFLFERLFFSYSFSFSSFSFPPLCLLRLASRLYSLTHFLLPKIRKMLKTKLHSRRRLNI